jgi:hypothetical protein
MIAAIAEPNLGWYNVMKRHRFGIHQSYRHPRRQPTVIARLVLWRLPPCMLLTLPPPKPHGNRYF